MTKTTDQFEKNIQSAIRVLQQTNPDHATREDAIEMLENMQDFAHMVAHLDEMEINQTLLAKHIKDDIEKFHKLRSQMLHQEYLSGNLIEIELSAVQPNNEQMAKEYLKHILKTGSAEDRQAVLGMIKTKFVLSKKQLRMK